ncbi:MAG: hypothetical protein ACKPKO_01735 [Candidatus Fonsibacter sp.]
MQISDIEVSNIRFGKLEDNIRMPSQKIACISYETDRTPLNAITPELITEPYGIPREGPYYQTDRSRAFFNMPFFPRIRETRGRDRLRGDRGVLQQAQGDRRLLGQQRDPSPVVRREAHRSIRVSADRACGSGSRGYRERLPTAIRKIQTGVGIRRRYSGI